MCRHFRIKNLLLALVTFLLGVLAANLFSSMPGTRSEQEIGPEIARRSETCIAAYHSGPESRRYHGERENLLVNRIRETEIKLIELNKQNGIYSPKVEQERLARIRRQEARLHSLHAELKNLLRDEAFQRPDKTDGTKLVYHQVCYEH